MHAILDHEVEEIAEVAASHSPPHHVIITGRGMTILCIYHFTVKEEALHLITHVASAHRIILIILIT